MTNTNQGNFFYKLLFFLKVHGIEWSSAKRKTLKDLVVLLSNLITGLKKISFLEIKI